MSGTALIYRNLFIYRLGMNLLYSGRYRERFHAVADLIRGYSVTELCFADTHIAESCRQRGISWTGLDLNEGFVRAAQQKGFEARLADVRSMTAFPQADTCIITGSLYHFHDRPEELFRKMLDCAGSIIISEPVMNLSSGPGIIGKLARASASVDGEEQAFRYTEQSLRETIHALSLHLGFQYQVEGRQGRDLIISIRR